MIRTIKPTTKMPQKNMSAQHAFATYTSIVSVAGTEHTNLSEGEELKRECLLDVLRGHLSAEEIQKVKETGERLSRLSGKAIGESIQDPNGEFQKMAEFLSKKEDI